MELVDPGTGILGTGSAGGDGSWQGAFSDLAELLAVVGFNARGMAAGTVDVFGLDGGVVEPAPFLGDLGAKGVIVFLRGDERPALSAIETTVTDHRISLK